MHIHTLGELEWRSIITVCVAFVNSVHYSVVSLIMCNFESVKVWCERVGQSPDDDIFKRISDHFLKLSATSLIASNYLLLKCVYNMNSLKYTIFPHAIYVYSVINCKAYRELNLVRALDEDTGVFSFFFCSTEPYYMSVY